MDKKHKKTLFIIVAAVIIVASGIAYAYFRATVTRTNQTVTTSTGTLRLTLLDAGATGYGEVIHFGETRRTTFQIENTGTLDASVNIYWKNLINTYLEGSLKYTLKYGDESVEEANYEVGVTNGNVPTSPTASSNKLLTGNLLIPADTIYNFTLDITLIDSPEIDQTADLNAHFSSEFTIKEYENPSLKTLAALGLTKSSETPDFSMTSPDDVQGIFEMEDDIGTSYYFRGNITNNYVKFGKYTNNYETYTYTMPYPGGIMLYRYLTLALCEARHGSGNCTTDNSLAGSDMYWRIVRINGNGSLRLIYDGTSAHDNNDTSSDRLALNGIPWNNEHNDVKYVGYMYGGSIGVASTSKAQAQANETDSNIKTVIDSWYEENFRETTYEEMLADEVFCNDRSTAAAAGQWGISGLGSNDTTLGYGRNETYFGAVNRIFSLYQPSFKCPQRYDAFTVGENSGNRALKYPIGLITADELNAAGSGWQSGNEYFYLYKGSEYWTLSPSYSDSYNTHNLIMSAGSVGIISVSAPVGVAPVINLSADVARTLVATTVDGKTIYSLP